MKVLGKGINYINQKKCLFDIELGRVNSNGLSTEISIKMSRFDGDQSWNEVCEANYRFPEKADINAKMDEVWKESLLQSAKALYEGSEGMPLTFGLKVLKMAEIVGESIKNGSEYKQE